MSSDFSLSADISADASGVDEGLKKAQTAFDNFGQTVKSSGTKASEGLNGIGNSTSTVGSAVSKLEGLFNSSFSNMGSSLKDLAGEFLPVLGAAAAVTAAIEFGEKSFEEYGKHTDAINDLGAALQAMGVKDIKGAEAHEEAFADSMQDATNVGRDQTLQLEGMAAAMGVHQDRLEETTKAAMGLSKVYGLDMKAALEYVIRAQEGNTTMLSRYIPELKNAGDAADKYTIILNKAKVGLSVLSAETEDGTGPLKNLQNKWADFEEKIGEVLAKAINPILSKLAEFMPVIEDVARIILDLIKSALDPLIGTIEGLFRGAQAFADLMSGDFSDALKHIKMAVSDVGEGFEKGQDAAWKAGKDTMKAFTDGISSGEKPKADLSINNGGAKDAKTSDSADKIKSLTEIITEGQAHLTAFGESRLTTLKEEIKEIQDSMQKLLEKGMQNTKQFQDLADALGGVKALQEATKISESYSNLTPKDLEGINITQPDGKAKTPAQAAGPSDASLKQVHDLLNIQEMANQAKAAIELFGATDLSRLNASLLDVENQMIKIKAAGQDSGAGWDNLVEQQKALKTAVDNANASMDKQKQSVLGMNDVASGLSSVFSAVSKGIGDSKVDVGASILKSLGQLAEKKGEFYLAAGAADLLALNPMGALEIAGGTALIAAGAKLSATKMASGGIVSGSAFVNVGEYPGAAHNPEVIAPLNKLQGMMGNGGGNHTFTVEGPKLVTVLDKVNTNTMFHIGGGGA